ncbi:MAG: type II toxin-antitoxin system VapC family toxin [Halobacteria archaeon]
MKKQNALFDSSTWIELFNGSPRAKRVGDYETSRIYSSTIALYEVYRKYLTADPETALRAVDLVRANSTPVPVSAEVALRGAELRVLHRKLSMANALILATAEAHRCELVTGDRGFEGVREVPVVFI